MPRFPLSRASARKCKRNSESRLIAKITPVAPHPTQHYHEYGCLIPGHACSACCRPAVRQSARNAIRTKKNCEVLMKSCTGRLRSPAPVNTTCCMLQGLSVVSTNGPVSFTSPEPLRFWQLTLKVTAIVVAPDLLYHCNADVNRKANLWAQISRYRPCMNWVLESDT